MPVLEVDPDFTPRNVAKYAVTFTIKHHVVKAAKAAADNYTQFDPDIWYVKGTCNVIGWGVSATLKPTTDKVVDKTADYIVAKREKRMKDRLEKDKKKSEEDK